MPGRREPGRATATCPLPPGALRTAPRNRLPWRRPRELHAHVTREPEPQPLPCAPALSCKPASPPGAARRKSSIPPSPCLAPAPDGLTRPPISLPHCHQSRTNPSHHPPQLPLSLSPCFPSPVRFTSFSLQCPHPNSPLSHCYLNHFCPAESRPHHLITSPSLFPAHLTIPTTYLTRSHHPQNCPSQSFSADPTHFRVTSLTSPSVSLPPQTHLRGVFLTPQPSLSPGTSTFSQASSLSQQLIPSLLRDSAPGPRPPGRPQQQRPRSLRGCGPRASGGDSEVKRLLARPECWRLTAAPRGSNQDPIPFYALHIVRDGPYPEDLTI
ncbi:ras and Rab interactor 3-like [Malaclemys terrapin pileata]|uniref:ras and Rab interactor 3-like n=1 Tax=Malaclemys terrapin pileata TaxID=2991368 RepID=UPI0023A814DE|nr:ras and Rab interactor 3-like [Malaclemys terrapin pileata]